MSCRTDTNFGPNDEEARTREQRLRRWVRGLLETAGLIALVMLAAIIMFPVHAHARPSRETQRPMLEAIDKGLAWPGGGTLERN